MIATRSLPLAEGLEMAGKIVEKLASFCDQIAVAGSIRRGKAVVNDIDIVCLPRIGQEERFRERCLQRARVVTNAPQTIVVVLENKVQVDLWIATPASKELFEEKPGNFGSLLLMRTGSREHNIHLVKHAKGMGLTWNPY
ncbi:MAG: hypothetical protein ACO1QS_16520 [Verrucomicrobiota bacterium]